MDVLCTDKTGTLTEGSIVLQAVIDPAGQPSEDVRLVAFLNAEFETGIDNPLDAAILQAGQEAGLTSRGYAKIDEIPYDFIRRRLTIVVSNSEEPSEHLILTKGAFAEVLGICSWLDSGGQTLALDERRQAALREIFEARSAQGFRVLAVATRSVAARPHYVHDDEAGMVFRGFLVFQDPPKKEAGPAIRSLGELGVRIKVISGDNRYVTAHLAGAIGLDPHSMLTGAELAKLHDDALWHLAPRTDLFVEIDPQQKERIVRALQRTGHTVGYLGDGINDAPALHAADVGISVEGAVDVARESADIVLLSRDLDVLREGIESGRRTFSNTLKYIAITTSANFGNMVSMALATPLLPFLPLAAKQILLNNFLSDIPSLAISIDNVDHDDVAGPRRWRIDEIRRFMIVFGLISSLFDGLAFAMLLLVFEASEATFQTAWFVISLLTELAVVLVLRTRTSALRSRPASLLLWSTAVVAMATFALPYVGPLSSAFGFVPLPPSLIAASVAIVLGYVAAAEATKGWFFRSASHRLRRIP
jgi:Mg2+-importing ATPase